MRNRMRDRMDRGLYSVPTAVAGGSMSQYRMDRFPFIRFLIRSLDFLLRLSYRVFVETDPNWRRA